MGKNKMTYAILDIILTIIFILAILNWPYDVVRFEAPFLNTLFMALVFLIPVPCLILTCLVFNNDNIQVIFLLIFAIPCILSLIASVVLFADSSCNRSTSPFLPLYEIDMLNSQVDIYRDDGGAMTPFWISAKQVETIIPGVVMEKTIYTAIEDDCTYEKIDDETIIIDGNEFILKDNVFF